MRTVEEYFTYKKKTTVRSDGSSYRVDANGVPIDFRLTMEDMVKLFNDANITPDQIGKGAGEYCLMRNDDIGHYEVGNCFFGLSSSNVSDSNSFNKTGLKFSEEHKRNLSNSHKNKVISQEQRDKISQSLKGRVNGPLSAETRAKLSVPKKTLMCPHCGKVGGNSQMKRWHFDNCKELKND